MSTSTHLGGPDPTATSPNANISSPSSIYSNSTIKASHPSVNNWPMSSLSPMSPLESRDASGPRSPGPRKTSNGIGTSFPQAHLSEYSRSMALQIGNMVGKGSTGNSGILKTTVTKTFDFKPKKLPLIPATQPEPSSLSSNVVSVIDDISRQTRSPSQNPSSGSGSTPVQANVGVAPAQAAVTSPPPRPHHNRNLNQDIPTASTESIRTVRAGETLNYVSHTPSYPFPRMMNRKQSSATVPPPPKAHIPASFTRAHTVPSTGITTEEQIIPSLPTPIASACFRPSLVSPQNDQIPLSDYPVPNLYNLTLQLTAEPGLDSWWEAVVQMMIENYKAERVSLSIPADSTDIDNVPWGQKATFCDRDKDTFSMGYLGQKTCSMNIPNNIDTPISQYTKGFGDDHSGSRPTSRPSMSTRNSYAKDQLGEIPSLSRNPSARRAAAALRRHSHFPTSEKIDTSQPSNLKREFLEQYDNQTPVSSTALWNLPRSPLESSKGQVLPVLQALDFEADPLIDNNGVRRVLDRGCTIALTRTFPYLKEDTKENSLNKLRTSSSHNSSGAETPKRPRLHQTESTSQLSDILGGAKTRPSRSRSLRERAGRKGTRIVSVPEEEDERKPPSPSFEEHEQAPSPWTQSPAPSPALRPDTKENPFFADAVVDESSFNPTDDQTPNNYASMNPPEAIGIDNSWTVIHVPLSFAITNKPSGFFQLDPYSLDDRFHRRARSSAGQIPRYQRIGGEVPAPRKTRSPPIAILSIQSPVIPYPKQLAESLDHLSPILAHSFSLARKYSMVATELSSLRSRRQVAMGFGGLGLPGGPATSQFPPLDRTGNGDNSQLSMTGSITSPSEWSAVSRSAAGSPIPTPSFEDVLGPKDKRPLKTSPALLGGDGYFAGASIAETLSDSESKSANDLTTPVQATVNLQLPSPTLGVFTPASRSAIFSEKYSLSPRRSSLGRIWPITSSDTSNLSTRPKLPHALTTHELVPPTDKAESVSPLSVVTHPETLPASPASPPTPTSKPLNRAESSRTTITQSGNDRRHSLLHSYGADFATSFPTLPQSTTVTTKGIPTVPGSDTSGVSVVGRVVDMAPPSDKLKGLILDSLPAQVFVAMPLTGQIVWVNSRYLSYRGLSAQDLAADPYGSIHPDDRQEYLRAWGHSLRTGDQFSCTVRIKRFDDCYRWFYARAVASRDKRGVILQFLGSYMDIHDQHIAELKAARQEEIGVSEAKHRLLANLIPQIVFTAEEEGVTFTNDQWLSYVDKPFEDCLGMDFLNYVHEDDLKKFLATSEDPEPLPQPQLDLSRFESNASKQVTADGSKVPHHPSDAPSVSTGTGYETKSNGSISIRSTSRRTSRSSSFGSHFGFNNIMSADLDELIRRGVVKQTTDSTGRVAYTIEVRLRSKTGEYRWHLVRCVEIENINLVKTGAYFGSATDINDQKLLEEKLKEAMESKSRFLSNMSHEIRTPLIGISGMITFLQDTGLTVDQRDYTNTIQNSANSLLLIINDILDLSKAAAGMMKLSFEWFHTRSLIEDVNDLVSTMAMNKELELNYVVDANVPAWIKGDKVRIRQILLNVIGNAIKFTEKGEVFSHCRLYMDNGDGKAIQDKVIRQSSSNSVSSSNSIVLEFVVIDTGRGFSAKEAELIFKPFSQIDGSSTRQHGGSGLGLVISRQLVEMHGGRMIGTSKPGEGSQFSFTARFALPTPEDHPNTQSHQASAEALSSPKLKLAKSKDSKGKLKKSKNKFVEIVELPKICGEESKSNETGATSTFQTNKAGKNSETPDKTVKHIKRIKPSKFSKPGKSSKAKLIKSKKSEEPQTRSFATINQDLVDLAQAARASGIDILQMNAEPQLDSGSANPADSYAPGNIEVLEEYKILVICPHQYSREATTQHIEMTFPKDTRRTIIALPDAQAVLNMISKQNPEPFTHVVLNAGTAQPTIQFMEAIDGIPCLANATKLVLCDTIQRQKLKHLPEEDNPRLIREGHVHFINKPLRPSRFADFFDPFRNGEFSIDRNRSSAEQQTRDTKAHYTEISKIIGGKGYRVLLVEDNPVNRKVLTQFLDKIGVEATVVFDGRECIEEITKRSWGYYTMALCDLQMPQIDGFEACTVVRRWEAENGYDRMPFIALSANVLKDTIDQSFRVGFSEYITKPVDFVHLGHVMFRYFPRISEENIQGRAEVAVETIDEEGNEDDNTKTETGKNIN